jgi:hypothetical protein
MKTLTQRISVLIEQQRFQSTTGAFMLLSPQRDKWNRQRVLRSVLGSLGIGKWPNSLYVGVAYPFGVVMS